MHRDSWPARLALRHPEKGPIAGVLERVEPRYVVYCEAA